MANYAENIFQAIDVIVGARLSEISYDTTVKAIIINADKAGKGEYIVDDGSSRYKAYSETTTYEVEDEVYVSIPNGDYTQQKIITGKYIEGDDGKPFNYVDPMQSYVDISNNVISNPYNESVIDLIANDPNKIKEKVICTLPVSGGKMFDRLGIQADFRSWLGSYRIQSGTYGLKVLITYNEPTNTNGGVHTKTHAFYLDSASDFYGDPYNFTNFYRQKKVEDISKYTNISQISLIFYQSDDFVLSSGERLEYTDSPSMGNLFITNCYISFGYDLADFTEDKVLLYTLDGETYKDTSDPVARKKLLQARWIQYNEGDIICIDTHDEIPANAIVHWYKYELNEDVSDELAGAFWNEITDEDDNDLSFEIIPDIGKNSEKFKVIIESPSREYVLSQSDGILADLDAAKNNAERAYKTEFEKERQKIYDELRLTNGGSVSNETLLKEAGEAADKVEKVAALKAEYDEAVSAYTTEESNQASQTSYFESPILTLTNENQVADAATITLIKGLTIVCDVEGKKGNYKLYDDANYIMNTTEASKMRKMTATYDMLVTDDDILNEAEMVTWMIPKESTMIYPPEDGKEYDLSIPGTSFIDTDPEYYIINRTTEFPESVTIGESITTTADQLFRIKDYYVQSYTNNTVQCIVTKAGMKYVAEYTMNFGPAGSNGTDYTFVLEFANKRNALTYGDTTPVPIVAKLFDYENNEIEDCGGAFIEYSWYSADKDGGINFCDADGTEDVRYNEINPNEVGYSTKKTYFTTDNTGAFISLPDDHFYDEEDIPYVLIPAYERVLCPSKARLKSYYELENSRYHITTDTTIDTKFYNQDPPAPAEANLYVLKENAGDKKYYKENTVKENMGVYYIYSNGEYIQTTSSSTFDRNTNYYMPKLDTSKTYYRKKADGTFEMIALKDYYDREHDIYYKKNNEKLYTLHGFRSGVSYFVRNSKSMISEASPIVHIKMAEATSLPKFYILQAKIDQDIQELNASVKLTSYLAIPVRKNADYREFEGTTKIIYDAMSGGNPYYYKEPCQIYKGISSTPENGIYWTIEYDTNDAVAAGFYPTITSGGEVTPYAIYTNGLDPEVCICASTVERNGDGQIINKNPVWYQPLLIMENRYASSMLNSWDGSLTIDNENGIILSSMVGAGKKEKDNSYTGVLMGDIESLGNKNQKGVGVYGLEHGSQSFCLNTDGTAFFGKSGSGRIFFDGNTGVIKSGNYSYTLKPGISKYSQLSASEKKLPGMIIDLDDGILDIIGLTGDIHYDYLKATQNNTIDNFYSSNNFISDSTSSFYGYDANDKTIDDYKESKARITIQPSSPYLKIDSTKGHTLFQVGSGNNGFYLQSDNFHSAYSDINNKTPAEALAMHAYPYGAGTKINLTNGSIESYNFNLKATASYTSGTNVKYNGSYIQIRSDGNAYLKIHHKNADFEEYIRVLPNNGDSLSNYYTKNGNVYTAASGTFDSSNNTQAKTAYYEKNTAPATGVDLIVISRDQFKLHSSNYTVNKSGTEINMENGKITSYNFNITAKGIYRLTNDSEWNAGTIAINSSAAKYPFSVISDSTHRFRVRWDGQIEVGNGFKVESDGSMTATRGKVGGWYIVDNVNGVPSGIYSYNPLDTGNDTGVALLKNGNSSNADLRIFVGSTASVPDKYYVLKTTGTGDNAKTEWTEVTKAVYDAETNASKKYYTIASTANSTGFSVDKNGQMIANNATLNGATINTAKITNAQLYSATINSGTIGYLSGGTITGGTISGATISGGTIKGATITGGTITGGTFTGGTISVDGMISCGGLTIGGAEFTPRPLNADVAKVKTGSWKVCGSNNTFSITGDTGYASGGNCTFNLSCDGKSVTGTITAPSHRHSNGGLDVSIGGTYTQLIRVALKGNFLASELSSDEDA